MEIAILTLLVIIIILLFVLLTKQGGGSTGNITERIETLNTQLRQEINANILNSVNTLGDRLSENQIRFSESQSKTVSDMNHNITEKQSAMNDSVLAQLKQFEERLKTLETTNEQKLEATRTTISKQLNYLQEDNNKKLDEIRLTVDEKLQKTLEEKMNQSFKLVSERLEEVYKGLGEMQTLAAGVGDLKKVLSNVKTRGILGEIQLGAILGEILTPEQYDTETTVNPESRDHVEYAVKLPGSDGEGFVYLPIDCKFPADAYGALQDAYDIGDAELVKTAYKNLETVIKKCAKDIHDKYISPPYTTDFAIMFLPFEGLYAETVNRGLVEILQRDYKVNIAGPSTMAALLNSLQMGFKTLQIQKRSSEVWNVLAAVKTEFGKFEDVLVKAQTRVRQLDTELESLIGARTKKINLRLRDIEKLTDKETDMLLDVDE